MITWLRDYASHGRDAFRIGAVAILAVEGIYSNNIVSYITLGSTLPLYLSFWLKIHFRESSARRTLSLLSGLVPS